MSTPVVTLIVLTVLVVLLAGLYEVIDRKYHESERDRIIRESCEPPVPAAPDNEPGVNLADADECALIFSLPAYDPALDEGCERLWDAVRDTNTTEGD